jgi:3-hydroxybutyryl-CoA dehydratase
VNWNAPFDELAQGERFTTRGRTVTEADVVGFAALTGDWHPQHADAAWAAESPFGERIAHGMLLVSFAVGLVPFDPERVVALRRIGDVVFKRPVRLGETIRVEGEVAELRELDERTGLVRWSWRILGQDGRLACRASVDVLWRRDPESEDLPDTAYEGGFVPLPL